MESFGVSSMSDTVISSACFDVAHGNKAILRSIGLRYLTIKV